MEIPRTVVWDSLDEESRRRLLEGAVRDVARRSFAGAMVYFLTITALLFTSSCLHDHPVLTLGALAFTFAGGAMRSIAAARLLRQTGPLPMPPDPSWVLTLKISTLVSAATWGAFCAATLYFYADTWPSTYLLIAGAAMSGGTVTVLAPQLWLGACAMFFIVLPTGICAFLPGTARSGILGLSACGYAAFLMFQLRLAWEGYWKVATVPALDAMLSRQAATESAVRFQTLFEDAPGGIYLAFRDGRIEMANRALAQMLGLLEPEEIAGRNLDEFSPHRDRTEIQAPIESDWRREDGTQIRVHERIHEVHAGTDGQKRLLGIVEDVTSRFVADQARRQLIEILDETSDFVESISITGEILYRNRASRSLLGDGSETDLVKDSVWNRSGDDALRKKRLGLAGNEGTWQGESWLVAAAGKPMPVSQVVISHKLSDGSTHAYSIISRDISAMHDAQNALKETEEQLFQAQRMESLGRLAGGIAHDFNNLLTVIMGQASLLELVVEDLEAQKGVVEIGKAAARAADLTRQLLAFGRKQVLSKGVVDVNEIVKRMENMLRRLIGERIELVIKLSAESQTVMADAAQLEQVVLNLILNGRDAMPHGGVATIETATAPAGSAPDPAGSPCEYVRISVSDTGIGMDEDTMARVFEPFFTTKDPGRGTGLGLATAYGFITQSGGSIEVSSKPGAGTTFTVLLPKCADAVAEVVQQVMTAGPGGSDHILVVDDEPALRSLLRQTLAGYGYRVAVASDGEEALALARASPEPFDLLVTDVIMPGITGPQLASQMVSLYPGIAVLFISGYPGETEAERAAFGPEAAYLPKPFTAEVLLRHVKMQLAGRGGAVKAQSTV